MSLPSIFLMSSSSSGSMRSSGWMLRSFLFISLLKTVHSSPLYRLDNQQDSSTSPPTAPRDHIQTPPGGDEPIIPSSLPPTTQIIPAEEIKKVPAIVIDQDFDLEMSSTGTETSGPRELPGEIIRKPAPIIDPAPIKITTSPLPPTEKTGEPIPGIPVNEFHEQVENVKDSINHSPVLEEDIDEFTKDDRTEQAEHSELDDEDEELSQSDVIDKPQIEEECEGNKLRDLIKPIVPTQPSLPTELSTGIEGPFDEESLFRIFIYLVSILSESELKQPPSTWDRIVAGIQCVLRDCRGALPLRPTMSFPLDEDSFIIRKARDSLCSCAVSIFPPKR